MANTKPFFRVQIGLGACRQVLGFAPAINSITGQGLFLEPESAGLSALDNPLVIPDKFAIRELLPRQWQAAFDRRPGLWFVSKPGTPSVYFDTIPETDLPSLELHDLRGNRLARLYFKPVRIDPRLTGIDFRPIGYVNGEW